MVKRVEILSVARQPLAIAVAALIVSGLCVRVWGLWAYDLSPDEIMVLLVSSKPTIPAVLDAAATHPHPPLRYVMLHYMLRVSENPFFLRSIAYVPGVALIPVFFLLGRRTAGVASAITMAIIATFSFAGILLSEVLRAYMLGVVLISLGLYSFFSYVDERHPRSLILYSAAMTLGLLSHYFTIIPVTAVCVVWVVLAARSRHRLQVLSRAALANLSVAVVAVASYGVHLSTRYSPVHWNNITTGWLATQFPTSLSDFLSNASALFGYFFMPQNALWMALLFAIGIVVLWRTRHVEVTLVILLTIAFNVTLTLAGKYPFGGVRQCVYLLPLVSISVGAVAQGLWSRVHSLVGAAADSGELGWLLEYSRVISNTALVVFLALLVAASLSVSRQGFFREQRLSTVELPVTREAVEEAVKFLREHYRRGDILFADGQTVLRAQYAANQEGENVGKTLARIRFEEFHMYYSSQRPEFLINSGKALWSSFEDLTRDLEIDGDARIWLITIGWQPIKKVLAEPSTRPLISDQWARDGASVYGFEAEVIAAEVQRQSGDHRAAQDSAVGSTELQCNAERGVVSLATLAASQVSSDDRS